MAEKNKTLIPSLLKWHQNNRRKLPWRQNPNPYSVWISEIMLQQTVVRAVIPFYKRWMERYPDVFRLSKAGEHEVLRLWEGLGYYNRARNILKTARIIVSEYKGKFPSDYHEQVRLPGIGDYTASAIGSIAFGLARPAIDANVKRVARRLFGMLKWDNKNEKRLRQNLEEMIPQDRPGDFNQAFMELGQTVCTMDRPRCTECPVQRFCVAWEKHLQDRIPGKKKRKILHKETKLLIAVCRDKILIRQKKSGILKGLWVLVSQNGDEPAADSIAAVIRKKGKLMTKLPERIHYYTRYRDRLTPYVYRVARPFKLKEKNLAWVRMKDLANYPFPSVYRKILNDLEKMID